MIQYDLANDWSRFYRDRPRPGRHTTADAAIRALRGGGEADEHRAAYFMGLTLSNAYRVGSFVCSACQSPNAYRLADRLVCCRTCRRPHLEVVGRI